MKQLLSATLLCLLLVNFTSCTKECDDEPGTELTEREKLLIGKTWVYYQYFMDYNTSATRLTYKSSRSQHEYSLAKNEVKYNADGTYTEIDENGETYTGTWEMTDNGNGTKVVNSRGTFTSTIQLLTNNRYEWVQENGRYGVMIPKGYVPDQSSSLQSFLTSHTWKYDEYYTNFGSLSPNLVFKIGKTNSAMDLSKNRIYYFSNGTYTEIDEFGTVYNGTWWVNGNDVTVYNAQGTFTSTTTYRDSDRYEWQMSNGRRGHLVAVKD